MLRRNRLYSKVIDLKKMSIYLSRILKCVKNLNWPRVRELTPMLWEEVQKMKFNINCNKWLHIIEHKQKG